MATNNADNKLCLIAFYTVLLVLLVVDLVDDNNGWLSTMDSTIKGFILPFFFILLVIQESPLNINGEFSIRKIINRNFRVLIEKGRVCLFDNNLREVCVSLKTKEVVILVNLGGGVLEKKGGSKVHLYQNKVFKCVRMRFFFF